MAHQYTETETETETDTNPNRYTHTQPNANACTHVKATSFANAYPASAFPYPGRPIDVSRGMFPGYRGLYG